MLIIPRFPAIVTNMFLANRTPQARAVAFLFPFCKCTLLALLLILLALLPVAHLAVFRTFHNIHPLRHILAFLDLLPRVAFVYDRRWEYGDLGA